MASGHPGFGGKCEYPSDPSCLMLMLTVLSNDFLVTSLPNQADEGQLVSIYSQLPFDLFKTCVESTQLPMESTQKRFAFAKKVIASRKKAAAAAQMEEAAVLAMQGNGMAVVVTRKAKKGRSFFKVEG